MSGTGTGAGGADCAQQATHNGPSSIAWISRRRAVCGSLARRPALCR
ncbi:hypothetical protein [Ideonella dechloratans]|nr:hypothetical protein [Ideonella dechloratans]UFU09718.1 hypothetical protein LRM40_15660 [Ideonella dechloratans]